MRWWFWMIWRPAYPGGPKEYVSAGPYQMTTYDAFLLEFRTQSKYPTARMYRWVWEPSVGWVYDERTNVDLLAAAS